MDVTAVPVAISARVVESFMPSALAVQASRLKPVKAWYVIAAAS